MKAPWFVSDREVERFVQSKEEWILVTAKRLAMQEKKKEAVRLQLVNGDQLPFLDEHLTLSVFREESSRCRVKKAGDRLLLFVPYEADYEIRRMAIEKWYRKMAAQWILSLIHIYWNRSQGRMPERYFLRSIITRMRAIRNMEIILSMPVMNGIFWQEKNCHMKKIMTAICLALIHISVCLTV